MVERQSGVDMRPHRERGVAGFERYLVEEATADETEKTMEKKAVQEEELLPWS